MTLLYTIALATTCIASLLWWIGASAQAISHKYAKEPQGRAAKVMQDQMDAIQLETAAFSKQMEGVRAHVRTISSRLAREDQTERSNESLELSELLPTVMAALKAQSEEAASQDATKPDPEMETLRGR
jgi:methionine-rich copper-binding protein CopC